jgi:hypothetical protein
LLCVSRPADRDSIAGDLLEEYRAAREPALGRFRADVWYVQQVFSILWRVIWPSALALTVQSVFLALTVFRPGHHAPHQAAPPPLMATVFSFIWYGSFVGAPGVSILDAVIYFVAAYRGSHRTSLIRTGMLVAAVTSLVGSATLFAAAAIITPDLAMALFAQPSRLFILSVYVAIPLVYGTLIGILGGIAGRWTHPRATRLVRAS